MMKQKFLEMALSQVGYKEGKNNDNKYGAFFGHNHCAWCAYFVSWNARVTNVPKEIIPTESVVGAYVRYYRDKTGLKQAPMAGDLIIYKSTNGISLGSHVGIVYKVDNNYVYTVEGNTGNPDGVYKKKLILDYKKIKCYCRPDYPDLEHYAGTYPELPKRGYFKQGDKGDNVKDLQRFINWAIGFKLDKKLKIDGSYGPLTKSAVILFEKTVGTKANGKYGKNDLQASHQFGK